MGANNMCIYHSSELCIFLGPYPTAFILQIRLVTSLICLLGGMGVLKIKTF
jgi:hypothetical protein